MRARMVWMIGALFCGSGVRATAAQEVESHREQHRSPAQTESVILRQVWAGPERVDATGSVSPNGRFYAFTDWETGNLAVRDLSSGETRILTDKGTWEDSPESAWYPQFSPDGKSIAFGWYTTDSQRELRAIDLDGSNQRVLYRDEDLMFWPSDWFPDGKSILARVIRSEDGAQLIVRVSLTDSTLHVLKNLDRGNDWHISVSPDGRFVAYSAPQAGDSTNLDVFLFPADGGESTPVVRHPANDKEPVWTPDGTHLLFMSDRRGSNDLWMIAVADGRPEGLPVFVKGNLDQFWPIGFTETGSYFHALSKSWTDVYVTEFDLNADKASTSPIAVSGRLKIPGDNPEWSPDGEELAYVSGGEFAETNVLTIRELATGEERDMHLRFPVEVPSRLVWSPDGESVYLRGNHELHRVDLLTGQSTPSVDPPNTAAQIAWSRDGSSVYYSVSDPGWLTSSIRVRLPGTSEEEEIYHGPVVVGMALSPDDRTLAILSEEYSPKRVTLELIPVEGGASRVLITRPEIEAFLGLDWAPDGSDVIYGTQSPTGRQIWSVSAGGEQPRRLEFPFEGFWYFRLHPAGNWAAFSVGNRFDFEVWALEGLLRSPG
jgi:Tol biopolymer transport system component